MDFERLEQAWRSSANSPSEARKTQLMEEMMDTLKRKRRDFRNLTGLIGLALTLWTAKIIYDVIVNPFPFDVAREWAVLPLFMLPWGALFIIRAQHKRHLEAYPNPYQSTADTLRALIDENAMAQARMRWMVPITVVSVGLIAIVLGQLVAVGKMTEQNVVQGSLFFGAIFVGMWSYFGWEYFRKLRPEGVRLRRLLADHEQDPAA